VIPGVEARTLALAVARKSTDLQRAVAGETYRGERVALDLRAITVSIEWRLRRLRALQAEADGVDC
jgi:hypothetical protein